MKAFEVRKNSVQPQYDRAISDIERAQQYGWKSCHVCFTAIYPEVAEMLAADGFDIKIVKRKNDFMSYTEVSWENAKKDQKGTITIVDETTPKPSFSELLMGGNTMCRESNENKDGNDENNKTDSSSEE